MIENRFEEFKMFVDKTEHQIAVIRGMKGMFLKVSKWEQAMEKSVDQWTRKELLELCRNGIEPKYPCGIKERNMHKGIITSAYTALATRISYLNKVLDFLGVDLKVHLYDFEKNRNMIENKRDHYFYKQDIIDVCDMLINPQDKFIIYGLFSGIFGKNCSDLTLLKKSDVDLENKKINLPSGIVVDIDDYLEDILIDSLDDRHGSIYYSYRETGLSYRLNMNSEYVLKSRPSVKNNKGLDHMTYNSIRVRLDLLRENLNKYDLIARNIYRSGVLHKLNQQVNGAKIKQKDMTEFLKANNYKLNPYETWLCYESMYRNVE